MQYSSIKSEKDIYIKVAHNPQRKILEILSLFRVMNNYYNKKGEIQKQIQPVVLQKFKEGLNTIRKTGDWLFSVPIALNTLSDDFLSKRDSFKFPDSIILFEAWMNLGLAALNPRVVLHFKFPGLLKGEKTRNVFQFIFSSSRGFGFPIYFGPQFYQYDLKIMKYIEPFFKWSYTVCHKANQAIVLFNKKLKSKRHHPGEFESVIISEYENNIFKGINTLLHGFFTGEPKDLGSFNSLKETLQNVVFSYTIGDHAMSVNKLNSDTPSHRILETCLIPHEFIAQRFDVDFYSYIKRLMNLNRLLTKKIILYKKNRREEIKKLSISDRIRFRIEQLNPIKTLSPKFSYIKKLNKTLNLIERLREFLWTTPLFTHTIHSPTNRELKHKLLNPAKIEEDFDQESTDSILLNLVKRYEKKQDFKFEDPEIIEEIKNLRDLMAKMWLYFKERHFRYACRKLEELAHLPLDAHDYDEKITTYLDKLIPIISIYELFNRPLAESVYPESSPHTNRLGNYLARFFSSKYNPIGVNLMNVFNNLAFYNWSYFIKKQKLSYSNFFEFVLKLPIWHHIPPNVKTKVLSHNTKK
ncbi:MAG: hypothetical protein EU532_02330 [Promethearchaeota archaeon]|nr:MAG: hypothetical protein EU532_02330 [Candidatus Lokiarchaeota archaeon]